jgi:CheY-like chemotaxis protein
MARRRNILIIDDKPDITTYFSTVLSGHGYATRCANSGAEALELLDEAPQDLILLDLMMPEKTGVTLFAKLKRDQRFRRIPIIIITGIKDEMAGDHKRFFEGLKGPRPDAYLEKPVSAETLLQTVKKVLESGFTDRPAKRSLSLVSKE